MSRRARKTHANTAALRLDLERASATGVVKRTGRAPSNDVEQIVALLPHTVSVAWQAFLAAFHGVMLGPELREAFAEIAGHNHAPDPAGYAEAEGIFGRGSGKSETAAAEIANEVFNHGAEHLAAVPPGTTLHVGIIARSIQQGAIEFAYLLRIIERTPHFVAQLDGPPTATEIRVKGGILISILPMSKAAVRGRRFIFVVVGEIGWWNTGDDFVDSDDEVLAALRYGLIGPSGARRRRLLMISSPGPKAGALYDAYRDYFGKPSAPVLVVRASTMAMNPASDLAAIAALRERDPERVRREIDAEFTDAVNAFLSAELIDRAVGARDGAPLRPASYEHCGAADFGFKRDGSSEVVAHREPDPKGGPARVVVDFVRDWRPLPGAPLEANAVAAEMAVDFRAFGIAKITADQFCSVPMSEALARHGIELEEVTATATSKVTAFMKLRELLISDRISLPKHPRLISELRSLEQRISGGGHVQIAAAGRQHDDAACALAWCVAQLYETPTPTAADYWSESDGSEKLFGLGDTFDDDEIEGGTWVSDGLGGGHWRT